MSVTNDPNSWPELTYSYVEFYFWEPQHLLRTKTSIAAAEKRGEKRPEAIRRKLRSQEVPLNHLLNVFLRLVPTSVRLACLESFGIETLDLRGLGLLKGRETDFTQPDIQLESEGARVFIEIKIDAKLTLQQIQKYLLLHAYLDNEVKKKRPYLLLLLKNSLKKFPDIELEPLHGEGPAAYAQRVVAEAPLPEKLVKMKPIRPIVGAYHGVLQESKFGASTWQILGDRIQQEMAQRQAKGGELGEMLGNIGGDFLLELQCRGLWCPAGSDKV